MTERRFVLLSESCPKQEIESMMARVVENRLIPLHSFAPMEPIDGKEPVVSTNTIIPKILPPPEVTVNRKDFLEKLKGSSVYAQISELFGFNLQWADAERTQLESTTVRRYVLKNPDVYFKRLLQHEKYNSDVRSRLQSWSASTGYLVVGFLTTEGTIWQRSGGKMSKSSGEVVLPISKVTGTPQAFDPKLGASKQDRAASGHISKAENEEIFAIAYDVVKLKSSIDFSAAGFVRKDVSFGGPARGKKEYLMLSGDEVDSDGIENEPDSDEEVQARPAVLCGDFVIVPGEEIVIDEPSLVF